MPAVTRDSLMPLEVYAQKRAQFRAQVIDHKKVRTVHLGDHVTILFEDELTIRYQIQEMLRIEKIFETAGINDELEAYNPLVPDGSNFKATMLLEYADVAERQRALGRLMGIEDRVYIQVEGQARVYAIADEDLIRRNTVTLCNRRAQLVAARIRIEPQRVANFRAQRIQHAPAGAVRAFVGIQFHKVRQLWLLARDIGREAVDDLAPILTHRRLIQSPRHPIGR